MTGRTLMRWDFHRHGDAEGWEVPDPLRGDDADPDRAAGPGLDSPGTVARSNAVRMGRHRPDDHRARRSRLQSRHGSEGDRHAQKKP